MLRETFKILKEEPHWCVVDLHGHCRTFNSRNESIAMAVRLAKVALWRGLDADVIVGPSDEAGSDWPASGVRWSAGEGPLGQRRLEDGFLAGGRRHG